MYGEDAVNANALSKACDPMLVLYQLSYVFLVGRRRDLNPRPLDYQSITGPLRLRTRGP